MVPKASNFERLIECSLSINQPGGVADVTAGPCTESRRISVAGTLSKAETK
jgi:hypothetical protein